MYEIARYVQPFGDVVEEIGLETRTVRLHGVALNNNNNNKS